ncbi:outer membrane beta-barrel protein [Phenylobacterium sp.]|uniref:outer membrane beta-barrel protein n=1 Tax=Phenylobacterium sp. TaxID=1871053 RepID=UPI002731397A|nr:outer membrane beta-barrel protein [Phenylobacterium sp.]MDP1616629.1 outer membrane beta-barrel protein [Phenylobacterium sp.]MDP1987686.1 outer membrane beta-barrel protein [Phenylobacterium sp.]
MTADKRVLMAGAAIAVAVSVAQPAAAQRAPGEQSARSGLASASEADTNFARDRNISVMQRPRDGYQAVGGRMGAFTLYPKLSLTAEHNDNIYATDTNETDDLVWKVEPELNIASDWSRHALSAYARASILRYQDANTEDSEDYTLGANAQIDMLRNSFLRLGADWAELTEPRTSPNAVNGAVEPTRYETTGARASVSHELNRLRLSAGYDFKSFDYEDGRNAAGGVIPQNYRDRDVHTLTARADYAVSPATALFLEVSRNERDYSLTRPAVTLVRDSDGIQALVGANFELGAVARGEIGVGYFEQQYDDPTLNDIDGFGARAQVEWFPTQLTTVTFTGSRTIEESASPGSAGYVSANAAVRVDHELVRNILLTGQAAVGNDDYEGITREDDRFNASVGATYLLNRYAGVTLAYSHMTMDSSGVGGQDFKVNKLGATLALQF